MLRWSDVSACTQVELAQKKAALEREQRDGSQAAAPKWQNQGIRIVEDP